MSPPLFFCVPVGASLEITYFSFVNIDKKA